MATLNPQGTTTGGHEDFNKIEDNIPAYNNPGAQVPIPGQQPTNTSPLTGQPTGVKPPGWMKLFLMLLNNYQKAYFAYCLASGITPAPTADSVIAMLETQTDRLCARYSKEISTASL